MIEDMDLIQVFGFDKLFGQTGVLIEQAFHWFPYWAPFIFGAIFWYEWTHYIWERWRSNMKWVILEVKLPKEIHKTPIAMEIVLNSLYQMSGKIVWWDKYWKGKVKDWFSLEMVSIEGHIKFFIRTPEVYKNVIEAQIYGQYPDIEIYEVPDYTRYVDYRGKEGEWEMVGIEYTLSKEDPYPIKTYVDYGLDKEGVKEEFKTDPLTSVIEYLGSAGVGEQIWLQILVQSASKRYKKKDGSIGDWKDEGKEIIDKLTKRNEKTPEGMPVFKMLMATKGENEVIAAIERSMGKLGFDCGVRALYLVKKDKFNPSNIKALGGILRPFTAGSMNSFKPVLFTAGFEYPWNDFKGIRLTSLRKKQFNAYKQRSWFYKPRKLKPFVLTSEELATIYHFPGGVAQTPTFGRIASRKGEAPVNLPI